MASQVSGLHLPLNPIDEANQPPLHYLWVQDGSIIVMGVFWTAAYALYIRQAFRDKSYGMPIVALCANIGWEFVYGVVYPLSAAETLVFVPWCLIDLVMIFATIKFGKEQWKHSSMIGTNLASLIGLGCVVSVCGHIAWINTFASLEEAGFWAGFALQCLLGSASVIQLMSRENHGGHSWMIWLCRFIGTQAAVLMFGWRYWHYPADYPYVGTPLAVFIMGLDTLVDLVYPGVFSVVTAKAKAKVQ